MRFLILCAFVGMLNFGCTKPDESVKRVISGQVVDATTGQGIPFVELGVVDYGKYPPDTFGDEGHYLTDFNGFYRFIHTEGANELDAYEPPSLNAIAKNYFDDYPTSNYGTIALQPKCYLKLHFTTSFPNDTLIFYASVKQFQVNQLIINKYYYDTVYQSKIRTIALNGNMMNHFSWTVKKSGAAQNFKDSLKINAFDSTNHVIDF